MKNYLPFALVLIAAMVSPMTAGVIVDIPDDIVGYLSSTKIVPVNIDDATGVQAFDLEITYDTSLLDLSNGDVSLGGLTSGWGLTSNVNDTLGIAKVTGWGLGPLSGGEGSLLDLNFHTKNLLGSSALTLEGDLNEGGISGVDMQGGSIDVVPEPSTLVLLLGLLVAVPAFLSGRKRVRSRY